MTNKYFESRIKLLRGKKYFSDTDWMHAMEITQEGFEQEIYQFVDKIKDLLSPQIWGNILLDCSKNEILILWLLYRRSEVNMSQIAEYIQVPLNTATGIVTRMEKRELLIRQRSAEDKRIVYIHISKRGLEQIEAIIKEITHYAYKIMEAFQPEETALLIKMLGKVMEVMEQEKKARDRTEPVTKEGMVSNGIRRITIE